MRAELTWDELVETCSRLHTTRMRETWPGSGLVREGSEMLDVVIDGLRGQVVPTRMHEPGFYWRYTEGMSAGKPRRSDEDIDYLRGLVDAGLVTHG